MLVLARKTIVHIRILCFQKISAMNSYLERKGVERQYGNLVQSILDAQHDNSNVQGVQ